MGKTYIFSCPRPEVPLCTTLIWLTICISRVFVWQSLCRRDSSIVLEHEVWLCNFALRTNQIFKVYEKNRIPDFVLWRIIYSTDIYNTFNLMISTVWKCCVRSKNYNKRCTYQIFSVLQCSVKYEDYKRKCVLSEVRNPWYANAAHNWLAFFKYVHRIQRLFKNLIVHLVDINNKNIIKMK